VRDFQAVGQATVRSWTCAPSPTTLPSRLFHFDPRASYLVGRCRISASACNRFESAALLELRALSLNDREKV